MTTITETQIFQNVPRLNELAPDFTVKTTQGIVKLSDYRGRWLVLFSHPADFTPVCTTEFIAFAQRHDDFKKLGCELLGLSVDSNYSHIAWIRSIKEHFGVEVRFPVIEDVGMQVAAAYGMIQPAASITSAVRALFVIDDKGILRAMIYYPMTSGRSIPEVLRLVEALQTADRYGVATPEGWRPGDKVIVPPPHTAADAEKRMQEGYECTDWYFCRRELPTPAAADSPAKAPESGDRKKTA